MRALAVLCAVVVVASVASLGCSPSVSSLVRDHHYDEAFAAVRSDAHPSERDLVLRAALDDASPALHVQAVSQTDLEREVGVAARHLEDGRVLRLHTTSTPAPFDVSVYVELRNGGDKVAELDTSLEGLATKTGELAKGRAAAAAVDASNRKRETDRAEAGNSDGIWIVANLLTAGAPALANWATGGQLYTFGKHTPTEHAPPSSLPESSMPEASRLHHALARPWAPKGAHTDHLVVWRRVDESSPALALQITVVMHSRADIPVSTFLETTVPLPPGPSLDTRLTTLFGSRERKVAELGTLRAHTF